MWVFTETGFVSAVRKNDRPDLITVRSRDQKSLEPLAQLSGSEVIVTPFGDYQFRTSVEADVFADWVADQATAIDYDNFKNRVAQTRGYDFASALNNVWVAMLKTAQETFQDSTNKTN